MIFASFLNHKVAICNWKEGKEGREVGGREVMVGRGRKESRWKEGIEDIGREGREGRENRDFSYIR